MTFKQLLKFLITNNITETEYILLASMYFKNLDEDVPPLINGYAQKWGVVEQGKRLMYSSEIKEPLVKKGYLAKTQNGFELTDKFLDLFVVEVLAGNELIDNYPAFAIINNVQIPLKTTGRMALRKLYWECIGGDRAEHIEVMRDVWFGKKNNMLNMNVVKFIEAEFWRDLRVLRLDKTQEVPNITDF